MISRALVAVLGLTLAAGCTTAPPRTREVRVNLAASSGSEGSLTVSSEGVDSLVSAVMGGTVCRDLTLDRDLEAVLAKLDRGGSRARISITGDDGRLQARRRGGQLVLEFAGRGGGGVRLELPWAVTECLLGRVDTLDEALTHQRHPSARIELRSAEDDTYTLEVALR